MPNLGEQPKIESKEDLISKKPERKKTENTELASIKAKEELAQDTQQQEQKDAKALAVLRAQMNGENIEVAIDESDKMGLKALNQEADVARNELVTEVGNKDKKGEGEDGQTNKEKFGEFAKRERERILKIGGDVLKEAGHEKEFAIKEQEWISQSIEEYNAKVENLKTEIDSKKSNIIKRILEFKEIRELEKKLSSEEKVLKNYQERLSNKKEFVEAYDFLMEDESELRVLMDEAYKENAQWDENKRQELIKEEEKRDVTKLASKHGVFFVHDIVDADWKPSANNRAINTQKLDFNDQLDILQGFDPTIAVSTLHKDSKQETFGRGSWGVFLSGGRVLGGEPRDVGSVAFGLRDRRISKEHRTTQAIDDAISRESLSKYMGNPKKDAGFGYNELIVENPEIAGVYIKWDKEFSEGKDLIPDQDIVLSKVDKYNKRDSFENWWKIMADTLKRGMPIFVLNRENNTVRLMYDIDIKNKSFKITPEYDPSNIIDMPGVYKQHLGIDEKRKATMRVFDKVTGLIPENERNKYVPDGTEKDGRGLYNIH
jgi:hypothetical protein